MIRALYDLKALAKDTRQHLYSSRTAFKKGSVPDKIRFRMKSRLIMLKLRFLDVAQAVRETTGLTAQQLLTTRRELNGVNAALRDCERMLAAPAIAPQAPAPPADFAWAELPAGVPVEPEDLVIGDDEEPGEAWLDALAPPPSEEGVDLRSLPPARAGHCPVCGDADRADEVACPRCGVGYHRECWDYFGGCAIYGCGPPG